MHSKSPQRHPQLIHLNHKHHRYHQGWQVLWRQHKMKKKKKMSSSRNVILVTLACHTSVLVVTEEAAREFVWKGSKLERGEKAKVKNEVCFSDWRRNLLPHEHLNPTPPVVKAYWKGLLLHRSLSNFDVGIDQLALTIEQKTMQPLYCLTFPSTMAAQSLAFLFYK